MRYLAAVLLGALILALVRGGCEYRRAEGWRDYAHNLERTSATAQRAQEAMRADEAKQYREQANASDERHAADLDRVRALSRARVVGVRAENHSSTAIAISEADPARVPEGLPATAVVDSADVLTCGDLYAYSVAAREWALTITK